MNYLKRLFILNLRDPWKYNFYKNKRPLYDSSSLGLDKFILRKNKQRSVIKNPDLYKARLKESCLPESKVLVFSDDVIKMVLLAETDEDLDVVQKVLRKLCSQNNIRVQRYKFGPEIMRLFHIMNKPAEALAVVEDPLLYSEFQDISTFVILLDLLFENGLYEEVIKMYNYRTARSMTPYVSYLLNLLYFASCYKMNTKEAFEKALTLWQSLTLMKLKPGLRIRQLFATLSLNQEQNICAMEVLMSHKFDNISENIKCMALVKANRFNDAFERIKEILNGENSKNFFMPKDTVSFIEKEVGNSSEENMVHFQYIKEKLIINNSLSNEPLDKFLCEEISFSENKFSRKLHKNLKPNREYTRVI